MTTKVIKVQTMTIEEDDDEKATIGITGMMCEIADDADDEDDDEDDENDDDDDSGGGRHSRGSSSS